MTNPVFFYVVTRVAGRQTKILMQTVRSVCRNSLQERAVKFEGRVYKLLRKAELLDRISKDLEDFGHFSTVDSEKRIRVEKELPKLKAEYFIDLDLPSYTYM